MQTVNTQISTVLGSLDLKERINRRQLLPLSRLPCARIPAVALARLYSFHLSSFHHHLLIGSISF
jgi:hypothetical protein